MTNGKNIVLCSDGTGNTATKNRGTNVFKLYEAVDVSGHHDQPGQTRQTAFYDDGVGSGSLAPVRIFGGAFGWGLARNVRQLYRDLSRSYQSGDRIYLFGFSRGAFTVRTLAGLITDCGIIDLQNPNKVPWMPWFKPGSPLWLRWVSWRAWRAHRRHYRALLEQRLFFWLKGGKEVTRRFRSRYAIERKKDDNRARIHFIGVWDTVAAVGLPSDSITYIINKIFYRFSFPTQTLDPWVEKACHALAIDDERASFHPVLWEDEEKAGKVQPCECGETEQPKTKESNPRIEQVWFAGVHSNVGGGYRKQGMSLVALDWMMAKAEQSDLRFSGAARKVIREQRNVYDKLYNPRSGAAIYYRYMPRDIGKFCRDAKAVARIHASAFDRIETGTRDYAPGPPPSSLEVVDTPGEHRLDLTELRDRVRAQAPPSTPTAIWTRRLAHFGLVFATVFVIWLAARSSGGFLDLVEQLWDGKGSLPSTLYQLLVKPILCDKVSAAIVLGSLIVVWLIGSIAKSRIQSKRAAFWRSVFPRQTVTANDAES